jgi:NADPH:quinone reductase-like Zn-dependent oxidoreductase
MIVVVFKKLIFSSDAFMANYGLLVLEWPLALGVDASGVIVETGDKVSSLKVGDYVCGCTRLGTNKYSACQEYFLMDEDLAIPKPKNLSTTQAATLGVGIQTAFLALFDGLKLDRPTGEAPAKKDEWVVVLGGASSVGRSAVQCALAAGYQVLTSCSSKSAKGIQELGASTFDYKQSNEAQVDEIMKVTSGNIAGCFDAVAADDPLVPKLLFRKMGSTGLKHFATTNDWTGITDFEGGQTYLVKLGGIGRYDDAPDVNRALAADIPLIVKLVEAGLFTTPEYEVIGDGGFEDAIKAYEHQTKGAGGSKKVLVKISDE